MKIYLANGLFSAADQMFNAYIAQELRDNIRNIDLYVPQENAEINDKSLYADSRMIANADDERLKESDVVIAVIDGIEVDSGVACEIGKASVWGKPIFALYTDVRQLGRDNQKKIEALINDATENQFMYRNLYVIGTIKNSGGGVYGNLDDLISDVKNKIKMLQEDNEEGEDK